MSDRITSMARFDENIPEPSVIAECEQCGGEIYVGDEVKRIDENAGLGYGFVHDDCAAQYANEHVYANFGVIDADGNVE